MQLIDTQAAMRSACAGLAGAPWLAVDTEFVRERTYYPVPCLVQVASGEAVYGFDLIALDELQPLAELLLDPGTLKVLHAPRQDLELFFQLTGQLPRPVFDTQLAAAMCGHDEQVSYGALVRSICGEELPKDSARTDWSRRPLSQAQLTYAANDVTWLRVVYEHLRGELHERGRSAWMEEEADRLLDPAMYRTEPQQAWQRVKGANRCPPAVLGRIAALACWRETQAQQRNRPRGWILADKAMLELAQRAPRRAEEVAKLASVPRRFADRHAADVVAMLQASAPLQRERQEIPGPEIRKRLSEQATALMAWLNTYCDGLELAPSLVARRRDIDRALQGDFDSALFRGWRAALIGDRLRDWLLERLPPPPELGAVLGAGAVG